jgi:TetR/AcrR family transcriptional regulator
LRGELRELVDEIAVVINGWAAAGRISKVDPYHLMLPIWAQTQHYADFDVQVRAILGKTRLTALNTTLRRCCVGC